MPKYIVTLYEEVRQIWYINAENKDEAFDYKGSISGVGAIEFSVQFSRRKTPGYNIQFRPYIQEAIDDCINSGFENEL